MKLTPRLVLLLDRCEIDSLEYLRRWADAVRRMEEKHRGQLVGPAEHGGDEHPETPKTVAPFGDDQRVQRGRVR